ncbi:Jasmonate-zim domain protein [Parasponia andersonii]|uniref:Protein TIFY n=1 Tax=Parasponia andersonii TaxID=3476 RepID=A0A2P5E357_PARAD|nr:Jasmonate-zim domain protein [Parasponia andersonii]
MSAGTTTFRSILDKPLNQLTEDDISQLTREDCRKYLKEKGMRRPSWNKSQAIQQVISLKALLEPSDDSGAGALRKIVTSPPLNTPRVATLSVTSNSADSTKEASADVQVSVSAEESAPGPRKEQVISAPEPGERPVDADERPSPRSHCATDASVGQMTIFYCGKVNVYEGVAPEKARAIMHLAANPISLSRENMFGGPAAPRSFPWHLNSTSDNGGLPPSATISQPMQTDKIAEYSQQCWEKENDTDGQASRKVSLQRYLEKRKDRGRLKSKRNPGFNSSSLQVYLSHQVKSDIPNVSSSRSSTSSPTQLGPPQALCNTVDNQPKTACCPVDLNEKTNLEC